MVWPIDSDLGREIHITWGMHEYDHTDIKRVFAKKLHIIRGRCARQVRVIYPAVYERHE